jgi:hypothetical protein
VEPNGQPVVILPQWPWYELLRSRRVESQKRASRVAGAAIGAAARVRDSIAELTGQEFDAVVGMGCGDGGCPLVKAGRYEEWDVPDPKAMEPEPVSPGAGSDRNKG